MHRTYIINWGVTALANNTPVNVTGNLDATNMTGSNKLNKVTVSDNLSATVTNGSNTWTVTNSSDKGWTTIWGGKSKNGSLDNQPMGNTIEITGDKDITVHRIIGGQVTQLWESGEYRVVNNNIISISGSNTLSTDEIIGGYRNSENMTVHGNVIDISGSRTLKSTTDGGRLKIYGAKVGDDTALDHGNAESSIINISGSTKLKNADVYGGYTNVKRWGGHVLNSQINLSGDADLSTSSLYGAETINYHYNEYEKNNVLNIGYKNTVSTNPSGSFPISSGEDGTGTYLVQKPDVSAWNNNKVQNVSAFTAVKVWTMKYYDTPALEITGTGNFKYFYSYINNCYTVIDLSYLTSGKDFGTNYAQTGQDSDIEMKQNDERTAAIDLRNVDASKIFLANVKPGQDITIIKAANSNLSDKNTIYYNPLTYGYHLANGSDSLKGTYTGKAALENGNVVWKTGDITASSLLLPNEILDASGTVSSPLKLEKYGYAFDGLDKDREDQFSIKNMQVTNNTGTLISPSDSWTLVDGSDATSVTGLGNLGGKENDISYDMSGGAVTVAGKGTTGVSGNNLTYHLDNPTSLTYHTLDWASTDPVVSLSTDKSYDLSGTTVDWSNLSMKNLSSLKSGLNERTLLDANGSSTGLTDKSLVGTEQHLTAGTTLEGTGRALLKDGNVVYDADMHAQAQTHNVLMGNEAGIAALLESNDLVLDTMKNLDKSKDGGEAFATIGGGENRYETGSHITTNIWRSQAGFAVKNTEKGGAQAEYGLFYDYGDGSYRTYYNGRGNGKIDYKGAGIFGKRIEANGTYEEASLRFGRASNDAKNILHDAEGMGYRYKTDSMYNAIHVGFGKILDRGNGNSLDTYFRFFHTHLNGDSFDAGGHYDIDSLDSNVARIGTRWQHQDHRFEYYAGLAYEYEFSGKAYGTADGADIEGASIRGGSVRFEYGTSVDTGKWRVAINGSDYAGKRRGFNGNISLTCHIW